MPVELDRIHLAQMVQLASWLQFSRLTWPPAIGRRTDKIIGATGGC